MQKHHNKEKTALSAVQSDVRNVKPKERENTFCDPHIWKVHNNLEKNR